MALTQFKYRYTDPYTTQKKPWQADVLIRFSFAGASREAQERSRPAFFLYFLKSDHLS